MSGWFAGFFAKKYSSSVPGFVKRAVSKADEVWDKEAAANQPSNTKIQSENEDLDEKSRRIANRGRPH